MKRLIVNADDFGWSEAVTCGTIQAHHDGVLTSTTVMANAPGAAQALERARREAPMLVVGLHLNLTEGRPLAPTPEVAPLLDGEGRFRESLVGLFTRAPLSAEVRSAARRELEAQIIWARDHGLRAFHLDSHKHVHMCPALLPVVIELARRHGIDAVRTTTEIDVAGLGRFLPSHWGVKERLRQWVYGRVARRWGVRARRAVRDAGLLTTDWFFGVRATGGISAGLLEHVMRIAPEGTGEIMVHPGLAEEGDGRRGRLDEARPAELQALCDPGVRRAAEREGWGWVSYKELGHDE